MDTEEYSRRGELHLCATDMPEESGSVRLGSTLNLIGVVFFAFLLCFSSFSQMECWHLEVSFFFFSCSLFSVFLSRKKSHETRSIQEFVGVQFQKKTI